MEVLLQNLRRENLMRMILYKLGENMRGRIPTNKELEELLGVRYCNWKCRKCLYNNYGPRRDELGPQCGVSLISAFIMKVAHNFREIPREQEKKKLKEDDFL